MQEEPYINGLFGGTFDPVHYGHVNLVNILIKKIKFKMISIIPNKIPPHRSLPKSRPSDRKRMLELAFSYNPLFSVDDYELRKNGYSFTIETVNYWRLKKIKKSPLALIIGQDSFLKFSEWYQYKNILNKVHLIVFHRPGYTSNQTSHNTWFKTHVTDDVELLYKTPYGKIFFSNTPYFDISSRRIRRRIREGKSCRRLLPRSVIEYIDNNALY